MRMQNRLQQSINSILYRLNHKVPVIFLTPHERTIGNTAEEIHYGLMYARRTGTRLVLLRRMMLFGQPPISNREIFDIESPYILGGYYGKFLKFLGCLALTALFGIIPATANYTLTNSEALARFIYNRLRYYLTRKQEFQAPFAYRHFRLSFSHLVIGLEQIWNPAITDKTSVDRKSVFSLKTAKLVDWKGELERPVPITLTSKKKSIAEKQLLKMGLHSHDWFVCLHNREAGYHSDQYDRRNNKIENYRKAIEAICNAGGWVIRMGDSSMTRLPKLEQVIDYPFTQFKSELMDLFLIQNCSFFLGQNSGIVDVAYLMNKKCILANVTEWCIGHPRTKHSLTIFKHYYSKRRQSFLSIRELLKEPFSCQDLHRFNKDYSLVENSADEIYEVVRECLSQDANYQHSELQREFLKQRRNQLSDWLNNETLGSTPDSDRLLKYRIASRLDSIQAPLGQSFLEKNWDYNSRNR